MYEILQIISAALKIINCDNSQFGVLGKQSRISCSATAGPVAVISSWDYGGVPLRSDDKSKCGFYLNVGLLDYTFLIFCYFCLLQISELNP